jgi:hypothetical protein
MNISQPWHDTAMGNLLHGNYSQRIREYSDIATVLSSFYKYFNTETVLFPAESGQYFTWKLFPTAIRNIVIRKLFSAAFRNIPHK